MNQLALFGLAAAALPVLAAAQTSVGTDEVAPVVVSGSKVARTIDCHGADLAVVGAGNTLTVTRCNTITVLGDANHMRARLLEGSSISAPGNRNVITWIPAPGWSPRVSATGTGNRINPEFSAIDLSRRAPPIVKAPDGAKPPAGPNQAHGPG